MPYRREVWKHFADLAAIERLSDALGVQVRVYGDIFDPRNREEYLQKVLTAAEQSHRHRLLFLDPDSGIEPGVLQAEYASASEAARLWNALELGEVLGVYQHAAHQAGWVERSVDRMARACQDGACGRSCVFRPIVSIDSGRS